MDPIDISFTFLFTSGPFLIWCFLVLLRRRKTLFQSKPIDGYRYRLRLDRDGDIAIDLKKKWMWDYFVFVEIKDIPAREVVQKAHAEAIKEITRRTERDKVFHDRETKIKAIKNICHTEHTNRSCATQLRKRIKS